MATTATAPSAVRYAPEDHSLPKPWKGLVDDRTGYLYFWNPETNVTQYEIPTCSLPPKFVAVSVSPSVQLQQAVFSFNKLHPEQMVAMVLARTMISIVEIVKVGLRLSPGRGLVRVARVDCHIQMVLLTELGILHMIQHLPEFLLLHQLQEVNCSLMPTAAVMKLLSVGVKYHHL